MLKIEIFNKEKVMVYFHTGDGQAIEKTAKEFCQKVIRPNFEEYTKARCFSKDVFLKMGKLGFLGAMIPEEYGGVGMNMKNYAVLMESLACYGGGSIALTLTAHHSLAASHIMYSATEDQKKFYLPKLASGEMIGAWCLTEPDAGSDAFGKGMKTTATLTDSGWIINGPKQFITNGSIADVYVVIAKKIPDPDQKNFGVFIVPRGGRGVIHYRPETNKMGMHASDTAAVTFENVEVGFNAKMEGDGKSSVYEVLNKGRVGISALACGLMRSALSEAVAYAKERKTFGRPIAEYQGISFPLADASSELTSSWAMIEKAALATDQGTLLPELAAETKLRVTRSSYESCLAASNVFGGYGYLLDYRVVQDFCDSRLLQIGEGADNIQRLSIVKALFR